MTEVSDNYKRASALGTLDPATEMLMQAQSTVYRSLGGKDLDNLVIYLKSTFNRAGEEKHTALMC